MSLQVAVILGFESNVLEQRDWARLRPGLQGVIGWPAFCWSAAALAVQSEAVEEKTPIADAVNK